MDADDARTGRGGEWGFSTRQLHAGAADDALHARRTPIYLTAGFSFDSFDEARDRFAGADGYTYTRVGNPTTDAVERRIAALEGGREALLVGSGQAAVSVALLTLASAGDHVVAAASLYEGTRNLLLENLARLGVSTTFVEDADDPLAWEQAITPRTRAVLVESIPNPRNDVVDLQLVADAAHRSGVPLVVDNTFATPYLLRPIEHGADVVVHSASKFLAGHGAVIAGVVVDSGRFDWEAASAGFPHLATGEVAPERAFLAYARDVVAGRMGPTVSPLTSFLLEQGLETLSLRVRHQSRSALLVARWLEARPEVESVDYSGLSSSPSHTLAQRYLPLGQGSVFSFTLRGGLEAARRFSDALDVFTRMTHLGDVRSLILHPASTTHTGRTLEQLEAAGIGPGLLRLSIGIEDVEDLLADLEQGLRAAATLPLRLAEAS
ncbi:aminotransferase class I/II-fold pyridoxal phosphate-dependent enzyme [Rathayibacter sp. VKM Ac-2803]|uniref:O-acetylhomoserine aminocarboxypropyltransferase/cysteine synthase family protein n=1 Tax=unclassified Rathayibacter TaxID=2609250 RepID=UPI00135BBDF7|nr:MULTISPECIES: aminotransferase class I/II-fold pyridoxal phosphate-dependent enzyme [unclassified Rathayibacter]MWV49813.1 aminotransferase class I/II-fold pyridoxal phosphate-dependent enzyme [Rathayibacter sp. VKM Ac-2803]MWV57944.1 aminotransferase class I/II-fold pyridoxal phosphate-dependent enzyme [Rathayibacter sp. VKM Ac-2754]